MKTLSKKANAKINLGLQVLNKRNDNYHNINTIFIPIDLYDEIILTEGNKFEIISNVDFGIPTEKNLMTVAAKKFLEATGFNSAFKIQIKKQIPMQAGLGGGSSNAATILTMLNEYYNKPLTTEKLLTIAYEIGSDVPFFIYNKPALARGRGEILQPLDYHPNWYVLVIFPNVQISTKEAYLSLNRTNVKIQEENFLHHLLNNDFLHIYNDFEQFAIQKFPEISDIKQKLLENGSFFAQLSGSGSAIYGLFDNFSKMSKAAEKFENYKTFLCKTL